MAGTYTNLLYHIVFCTKERRPLILPQFEDELRQHIGGVVRSLGGDFLEASGMPDHMHGLLKLDPKLAVADIVRNIKASSCGWLNGKSTLGQFDWQEGFAAFTVSESQAPRLKGYLRNQKQWHQRMDYQAELLELFMKNCVEWDERYLWR